MRNYLVVRMEGDVAHLARTEDTYTQIKRWLDDQDPKNGNADWHENYFIYKNVEYKAKNK